LEHPAFYAAAFSGTALPVTKIHWRYNMPGATERKREMRGETSTKRNDYGGKNYSKSKGFNKKKS
tara:strand:- start:134 stop:328 length:195 start_codon:yes stop_codon:yes gene_type:complete